MYDLIQSWSVYILAIAKQQQQQRNYEVNASNLVALRWENLDLSVWGRNKDKTMEYRHWTLCS
jgi:hypothetical protein